MSALEPANAYFDGWNLWDAQAVLASFGPGGTYQDPLTGGPISGEALKGYMENLWSAFPDLSFEIASVAETGGGRVAAEWIMRGSNTGSFNGLPPTNKAIETTGSDFLETANGKVTKVTGYFDSGAVPRQLGLQVVVQPVEVGPFRLGTCSAVQSGITDAPGAFSVTQLEATDDEAVQRNTELARQSMAEMLEMPGFIGVTTATLGRRQITLSAWTDTDAPARFSRQGTHAQAMEEFFSGKLANSAYTSVWVPARINRYLVKCGSCGKIGPHEAGGACGCGAPLPDHPPYW